jgi:DNA-binding transcriptional MerR regulator
MLLRIGALSKIVGLSPDTLRHYERLGLLAHAGRTTGGFRQYTEHAVRRVRTIQAALEIGFSLRELAGLFRVRASGRPPCREARRLAASKLAELEQELARLLALRAQLHTVIERWDDLLARAAAGTPALLLESLADAHPIPDTPTKESSCLRPSSSASAAPSRRSRHSPRPAAATRKRHTPALKSHRTRTR